MFKYAIKRVVRSYKLFIALTVGVLVATTFFASTNVAADILARDALEGSLDGVVYDYTVNTRNNNWTIDTFNEIEEEIEGIAEVTEFTKATELTFDWNNSDTEFDMYGIDWNTDLADGAKLVSGRDTLGPNETYVVAGSRNESSFLVDNVITVPISVGLSVAPFVTIIEWNFTIAGFIEIPTAQRYTLQGSLFAGILLGPFGFSFEQPYNMMLTDWSLSMDSILSSADSISSRTKVDVQNNYYLKVNRDALIDPYDIEASTGKIQDLQNLIASRLDRFNVQVSSNLLIPLFSYMIVSLAMNLVFISLSIPILFMAYFTGTMVSDVGYNLRRREIGLLLTKGYKRGTIRNMFLIEGMFVGAIAGTVAVFLGAAVSYVVLGLEGIDFATVLSNNSASIVISIILGMSLALISVWRPANRASKLEILDALKQYVYIEETSEYKRLLPTISFLLGTYKLIVWSLGISISSLLSGASFGNLFIAMGIIAWVGIDSILNYFGPIMFLFGATKLFMRGSQKFQQAVVSAGSRFFGAFGKLATRNVERNPARTAAMVFLISLIVSYGVYTAGALYTEYDRVERANYHEVGSDVRLELEPGANITTIMEDLPTLEEVETVTPEYRIDLTSGAMSLEVRGIRPDEWSSTAFWEPEWFIGEFETMLDDLDDNGIILSVTVANDLGLEIGDNIFVRGSFFDDPHELTIVGFIGYVSVLEMFFRGGPFGDVDFSIAGEYPSFVSESFLNESDMLDDSTANILIKTIPGANGTAIQEYVAESFEGIENSYSFTSQMENYFGTPIQSGVTKIQWVAIVFSVILACVGTALVIILSLKEKDAEIALITVRGFSKWQLFKTLMAEMLVMVIFSLLLGTIVGLIQVFGNVNQLNEGVTGLIRSRVILGGMTSITMLGIIGVVLLGAAIPVMLASRRPEAKVDVLRA